MVTAPSGTLTFLFTDIEGSSRLWEQEPVAMRPALARHDALLRRTIESHGGYVFKTVGDAFYAAFPQPVAAVSAALVIQRGLKPDSDGQPLVLRVRMGLHTGTAEERDGDYFGASLNRVARLLAAGHGGQVLLSRSTYELVRDTLPDGVTLRDLGEHHLKDLTRPEHVYQLVAPDLPADFPPLRTLDSRPNNLPVQPSPLIGRDAELRRIHDLLLRDEVRLLTLTGPGGTGKTRLSLQAAADLLDHFENGAFFVNLAPLSDPVMVLPTIAQTLELPDLGARSLADTLRDYLRDYQMLLVLDNFEQVIDAAPDVATLLTDAPRLKVLVTSRTALRLRAEHEFPVPPLGLPPRSEPTTDHRPSTTQATTDYQPPATQRATDLDTGVTDQASRISHYAAVRLFIERARAVKPDFRVTNTNAPAVAEICYRLDGLPLAIELAAARVRLLSPEAILQRLDRSLSLLTGGARDLPQRQKTLRDAIAWSYDLLDATEKTLFRRLSVFVGGFTLDAAEAIAGGSSLEIGDSDQTRYTRQSPIAALDGIDSLVAKSLLTQREDVSGDMRFAMLETIREFAADALAASDEVTITQRRHADFYIHYLEDVAPALRGPDQVAWLDRLEPDLDNVRAALAAAVAQDDAERALRLAAATWWFWDRRGYWMEGLGWLTAALRMPSAAAYAQPRARVLVCAGALAWHMGDLAGAHAHLELGVALLREQDEHWELAHALEWLTVTAARQGDVEQGDALAAECVALFGQFDDPWGWAMGATAQAVIAFTQGDLATTERMTRLALDNFRAAGDLWGVSQMLNFLGDVARNLGDYGRARRHYEEALALYRQLGNRWDVAAGLHNLGYVERGQGNLPRACALFAESLTLQRAQGNLAGVAECLEGIAGVWLSQARLRNATRLYGAASALRQRIQVPIWHSNKIDYERSMQALRSGLGAEDFEAAWAEGNALPLENAVREALASAPSGVER